MKKQFLNLGKVLSKAEQESINGGASDAEAYCDVELYGAFWCCQMNMQYCNL